MSDDAWAADNNEQTSSEPFVVAGLDEAATAAAFVVLAGLGPPTVAVDVTLLTAVDEAGAPELALDALEHAVADKHNATKPIAAETTRLRIFPPSKGFRDIAPDEWMQAPLRNARVMACPPARKSAKVSAREVGRQLGRVHVPARDRLRAVLPRDLVVLSGVDRRG